MYAHSINGNLDTDTPSELAPYADGMSDDAAYESEIIGCSCAPRVSGLGDLLVAGIPSYLLTRKSLQMPEVRRRIAAQIKAMAPKTRRRVLGRLRAAVSVASRVSGAPRRITPMIGGIASAYPSVGWGAVAGGMKPFRCPYANVSGALTP